MARPFENRIQDFVYNVDVGAGLRLIRTGLFLLLIFIVMLVFTATQFHGLRDAEAMEYAQLARNLALRGKFVTQVIRPASIGFLIEHSPSHSPQIGDHPDILHAPLYPAILAAIFKVAGVQPPAGPISGVYGPEQWILVPLGHACTLLTGLLLYLLGRRLFDHRAGLVGVIVFFLSESVWRSSLSGLNVSLAMLLATAIFYCLFLAIDNRRAGRPPWTWLVPVIFMALLGPLAFLNRYGAAVLMPAVLLGIGVGFGKHGWRWALAILAVFLIGIAPWLARNQIVSGRPLGLAPATAYNSSNISDEDTYERQLVPNPDTVRNRRALQAKWITNLGRLYHGPLRTTGEGLVICLFIAALFHRFLRPEVNLLRWSAVLGLLMLLLVAALFGDATWRLILMFWPVLILVGMAFLLVLLDRLQFSLRILNIGLTGIVVLLSAIPLILALLPPREGIPYPPYYTPFIQNVCRLVRPSEMICTDMPWATAWYGNRTSLYLPATLDDFYEINDYIKRISGLYFTNITRDQPFIRKLVAGPYRSWFPLLEGRIPPDFPLNQGFPINNLDQLFLSDRARWLE